jgi:stearoyl-CoA desaturase (Delta-9 desaturase)
MTVAEVASGPSDGAPRKGGTEGRSGTDWVSAGPFLALHLVPLAVIVTGFGLVDLAFAVGLYLVRMLLITAGYHRYFAHRSYQLSRPLQLAVAVGGITAAQKGPIWWASHHRRHHRYADTPRDVHSPIEGMWWSHLGWILSSRYKKADRTVVGDLTAYPELRAVERCQALGPWLLGALCWAVAGWGGVVAFALSTVALWHATFSVNSIAHRLGRRRYETPDTSRNCWPVALLTLGEGWHNNHHHYPPAARQSHRWWELDCTWYVLRVLAAVRIVRGLRAVPSRALAARPARTG